jgi:hypothetical protein
MERGLSQREEGPMGVVSILPMLPEREEVGDGEERVERSSSRAEEKGSPCTEVEEGGMNGHRTWKGKRFSRTGGID